MSCTLNIFWHGDSIKNCDSLALLKQPNVMRSKELKLAISCIEKLGFLSAFKRRILFNTTDLKSPSSFKAPARSPNNYSF